MSTIKLSKSVYKDKVMGCWKGKMAGGTLGQPVEKMWGEREPFDVSFYVDEVEGGIPNDDLEIQLIWLMALEDRGLGITSNDLAEYWLNTINYNPDEYGMHKTNLRQGLIPPISGAYNNYFKDCMGSPIRSEIWACIAPGLPHVAAHYAWHDAVLDHAQGESVYGEVFNAAIESSAFLISDRERLLDIGLSVIPEKTKTARTIRRARKAHAQGLSWLDARNDVMEFAYHPNAQHSPINLGFQTLAWLYGEDFGDTIIKAVNAGWDTDCTAATVGSILGIINGAAGIPDRWMKPLGNSIKTNESWNGLKNLRVPETLEELTERTVAIAPQVLAHHGNRMILSDDDDVTPTDSIDANHLIDTDAFEEILKRRQDMTRHTLSSLDVGVVYPNGPVISNTRDLCVELQVTNRTPDELTCRIAVSKPKGFEATLESDAVVLAPHSTVNVDLSLASEDVENIQTTNRCWVELRVTDRPATEAIPVIAIGARRWMISPLYENAVLEDPDEDVLEDTTFHDSFCEWQVANFVGNELAIEPYFCERSGVLYMSHHAYNPSKRSVRIGVPNNNRMKLWLNGELIKQTVEVVPLRPSNWGDDSNYVDCELDEGWHHFLIKLERTTDPIKCHFVTSYAPTMWYGIYDLAQTRFPWEAPDLAYATCNYSAKQKTVRRGRD